MSEATPQQTLSQQARLCSRGGHQETAFLKGEWELAGQGDTPGRAHSTGEGPEAVERDRCGLSLVGEGGS